LLPVGLRAAAQKTGSIALKRDTVYGAEGSNPFATSRSTLRAICSSMTSCGADEFWLSDCIDHISCREVVSYKLVPSVNTWYLM